MPLITRPAEKIRGMIAPIVYIGPMPPLGRSGKPNAIRPVKVIKLPPAVRVQASLFSDTIPL